MPLMGLLKLRLEGPIRTGLPENFVRYSFRHSTLWPPKQWSRLPCLQSQLFGPFSCLTSWTGRAMATHRFACAYAESSARNALYLPSPIQNPGCCFLQEVLTDPPTLCWKPAYTCS